MLLNEDAVDQAVENWCGLEPIDYAPTDALSTLWGRSGRQGAYEDIGIRSLIHCVRQENVFNGCAQAKEMTVGMFRAGGGLQTKRDLFKHLENC